MAVFIIDWFARNKLVAIGTFFTTSSLVVEAALVANFKTGPDQNNDALKAAVAMTFCYIVSILLLLKTRKQDSADSSIALDLC
jgi:hypothetical protein